MTVLRHWLVALSTYDSCGCKVGRPLGGSTGSVVAAADATGSFVAIPGHATGFWVIADADAWIDVRDNNTAGDLDEDNAAPLAASTLYGPFSLQRSVDKYVVVAGNGAAAGVTITFVT
jgi:hypothetical protein